MLNQFGTFIFALCFSGAALAVQCNGPLHLEFVSCFAENVKISDDALNATYRSVKSEMPSDDVARLIEVQRIWIKYRDGACKEMPRETHGQEAILVSLACVEKQNNLRKNELKYLFGGGHMYGFYAHLQIEYLQRKVEFQKSIDDLAAKINVSKNWKWKKYVEYNCQMSHKFLREDMRTCYARQAFSRY